MMMMMAMTMMAMSVGGNDDDGNKCWWCQVEGQIDPAGREILFREKI